VWYPLTLANVNGLSPQEYVLFYFPSQVEQDVTELIGSSLANPAVVMTIAEEVTRCGATVNILLGLFNLIPAFPLDGGRVLQAALIRSKRNQDQATRTAIKVGIGISYVIMALVFITIFTGSFISGIRFLLIGWFLQSGAQSYLQNQEINFSFVWYPMARYHEYAYCSTEPGYDCKGGYR
jgi:Zn-dependent protease